MQAPVILPEIGVDTGTELVVSCWFAEEGDEVLEGDRLVEILAGSVTFDLPAPATGRLVEVRVAEDDVVHCGDVLALVETEDEESESLISNFKFQISNQGCPCPGKRLKVTMTWCRRSAKRSSAAGSLMRTCWSARRALENVCSH